MESNLHCVANIVYETNTNHQKRDEKVFFKAETFALFGFYDICALDDQMSSLSEIEKRINDPENVLKTN